MGYQAIAEGHEHAARDYERAASGRPSAQERRSHATKRDRAAKLIESYKPWESTYSNEDIDRTVSLAYQLTDIDREEGRSAPPVGFSKERYAQAKQVVEDTNRYGKKQQLLRSKGVRAHATIAGATPAKPSRVRKTRNVHVVQGNYGYGHGWEDVTAEETRKEALARLREYRENEPGVPFRLIRRRERVETTTTIAHARKKKIDHREAKRLLQSDDIDFRRDFHELSSEEVQRVLEVAHLAGYRKRKDASGSTARMYFQYLGRLK